ncbi:uncharacterized protein LOC124155147 [Ischnura elegans]|uniref:uncharacterized protein LOC124155147 n=1 Tax=Ischnura elegans TaxID=197161 RepID=UPI001ED8A760|nr:uncharacterized protein LOC124155147 [Ischnura elegans]
MYHKGIYPTVERVRIAFQEAAGYRGSYSSFRKIFNNLGFRYVLGNDGRRILMERSDIRECRKKFLKIMHSHRVNSLYEQVVYLDETWVNQNYCQRHIWVNSQGEGGMRVPTGKGGRLIVTHAGSSEVGFIEGMGLVFRSGSRDPLSDYHKDMNADCFTWWFEELLRRLDRPSIIVMDNASYHSKISNKIPNTTYRKTQIQSWLQQQNVLFSDSNTVKELLDKVKDYVVKNKITSSYQLDDLALSMGHLVVRLPPYHCKYNPIELIWAQVKRFVAQRNTTFRMIDVERLTHEALASISKEDWIKCVRHAENIQEEDYIKECVRDEVPQVVIPLGEESSDNTSDEF